MPDKCSALLLSLPSISGEKRFLCGLISAEKALSSKNDPVKADKYVNYALNYFEAVLDDEFDRAGILPDCKAFLIAKYGLSERELSSS